MINKIEIGYSSQTDDLKKIKGVDVALFGYGCYNKINFSSELRGVSHDLKKMAEISQFVGGICFFGVITNNYSLIKRSVVCCQNGKLLGISDGNFTSDLTLSCGDGYKLYNYKTGKIGVLVDWDIGQIEGLQCLTKCESKLIVALSPDFCQIPPNILTRCQSYLFGTPICFYCGESFYASNSLGKEVYFGKEKIDRFTLSLKVIKKEYKYKSR